MCEDRGLKADSGHQREESPGPAYGGKGLGPACQQPGWLPFPLQDLDPTSNSAHLRPELVPPSHSWVGILGGPV